MHHILKYSYFWSNILEWNNGDLQIRRPQWENLKQQSIITEFITALYHCSEMSHQFRIWPIVCNHPFIPSPLLELGGGGGGGGKHISHISTILWKGGLTNLFWRGLMAKGRQFLEGGSMFSEITIIHFTLQLFS